MSHAFALAIESLVAALLLVTIGYCFTLNHRLKRLKGSETTLKATISELVIATENAERAIAGLKATVGECDQTLGERLRTAERYAADIAQQIEAGEGVLTRLTQIAFAARPLVNSASEEQIQVSSALARPVVAPGTQATVVAAQAFAARAQKRLNGVAA